MSTRLLRLRAAVARGQVPRDLAPWVIEVATAAEAPEIERVITTPAQRLAIRVSDEVDRWMTRRGVNTRTISVQRRTLSRCLKGENVTIDSIADIADALGCDAFIEFLPRHGGVYVASSAISGTTPLTPAPASLTIKGQE